VDATLNPNLMRAIDFWVGIPLTFLLTALYRLQRMVGLAGSTVAAPRNILFIQLAEMGTMVVAYPALKKTRDLFPDATLHFLCFAQIRSSVEMLDIVAPENIVTIEAHSAVSFVRDTRSVARPAAASTRINMEAFVSTSVLSYLSGARRASASTGSTRKGCTREIC
jgi:hypothetical protein